MVVVVVILSTVWQLNTLHAIESASISTHSQGTVCGDVRRLWAAVPAGTGMLAYGSVVVMVVTISH